MTAEHDEDHTVAVYLTQPSTSQAEVVPARRELTRHEMFEACNAYGERIEMTCHHHDPAHAMQEAIDRAFAAIGAHPAEPVQAAQFDRAPETSRRQAAVELLLTLGWEWIGDRWMRGDIADPADDEAAPVAQSRDGWVLVPREPTMEMIIAGRQRIFADMIGPHMGPSAEWAYEAMLAAAPIPAKE